MLLVLTESTLFYLDLALTIRPSTADDGHVTNWVMHVAGTRQPQPQIALTNSHSNSNSNLGHRHLVTHSKLGSLGTTLSMQSCSLQGPLGNGQFDDAEVFSDFVDASDEKDAMMTTFSSCTDIVVNTILPD